MKIGDQVAFAEEPQHPLTVQAVSENYVILTRPIEPHDRYDLCESEEEYDWCVAEGFMVYTIIDRKSDVRGPDYWIGGKYNYSRQADIDQCFAELESGECPLSRRNSIPVQIIGQTAQAAS